MRVYRTRVHVTAGHELRVSLPSDFPAGDAEVIVLEASSMRRLSVDDFLAARLTPPAEVTPASLDDIERAIAEGASGRRKP